MNRLVMSSPLMIEKWHTDELANTLENAILKTE